MSRQSALALLVFFVMLSTGTVWAEMVIIESNGDRYELPLDCSQVQSISFADGYAELRCSGAGAPPPLPGGQDYTDSQGNTVHVPCGAMAFADTVVSYQVGSPAPSPSIQEPRRILGEPDYVNDSQDADLTLGCGGSVTVFFSKVFIIDVPGPDLHVFEVGPDVEPSTVEISTNGRDWIMLGRIEGGRASIDIGPHVSPGAVFSYVRITDLKSHCNSGTPGADIDAVAAIGCTPVR